MKRTLIFWGDDPDYVKEGRKYYRELGEELYEYLCIPPAPKKQSLLQLIKEHNPELIYIDFTHHDCDITKVLSELVYLRRSHHYSSIIFVGVFKNKNHLREMKSCIHYGIHYLYIKGPDIRQLFVDGTYITFKDENDMPKFARAKNLKIEHHFYQPGYISLLTKEEVKINCRVNIKKENVEIKFPLLLNNKTHRFSIKEKFLAPEYGAATYSYILGYNFTDPKDDQETNPLFQEDVEDIISNYPHFSPPHRKFLIHTHNQDIVDQLIERGIIEGEDFQLEQDNVAFRVPALKPEVIIFDYSSERDGLFPKIMTSLTQAIKSQANYRPTLLVFNSPMNNQDFKNQFGNVALCDARPSSLSTLKTIMGIYVTKKSFMPTNGHYEFKYQDNNALVLVKEKVTITSISEHEMTFIIDEEVPNYSIFKIEAPVNAYLLVVPPYLHLEAPKNKFHYVGIIMGLDFFESNNLRKFVNQIIFKPVSTLASIDNSDVTSPYIRISPPPKI